MAQQLIFADIVRTVEFHVQNMFGDLNARDRHQIEDYIMDHLNCVFDCYFLPQCTLCGGNWTLMLLSGIEYWMPEIYDAMPNELYKFYDLAQFILNWYLIAELPELYVEIVFELLGWDMDDISLHFEMYDWLYADSDYSPRW
jgi:hypothetical protein